MVFVDDSQDACREVLQNVQFLVEAPGADHAAEAFKLITCVARTCPVRVQKAVKAVAREVRDVFVLRCLSEMDSEDRGNRDVFLVAVARALGQTSSEEYIEKIMHSHRKVMEGKAGRFLSKTQQYGRYRKRRERPAAPDVQLGREINSTVSDEKLRQEINLAAASFVPYTELRELGQLMNLAVSSFLAGEEFSDGASFSD